MASSDHAEAPKAIRVIAILGIIGAVLSIIMVFVGIGVLEELPPILLFILILTIAIMVLCVQMYKNNVKAAYIYLVVSAINIILNIVNKDWIAIISGIIFFLIVLFNVDDMKTSQARYESYQKQLKERPVSDV